MPKKGGVVCVNTGDLSFENNSLLAVLIMKDNMFKARPGILFL